MATAEVPQLTPNADCFAKAQLNAEAASLLRLPAEIRNQIYTLAMDTEYQHLLHEDHYNRDRLSLSRTSRQLFAETAQEYFNNNLMPLNTCGIILRNLGSNKILAKVFTPAQKGMITRVVVNGLCLTDVDYALILC